MKYIYTLFIVFGSFSKDAEAQTTARNLLQPYVSQLSSALIPIDSWKPFPQSPESWRTKLSDSLLQQIIKAGETALKFEFREIPVALTLEYMRTGGRVHYEKVSFEKRNALWNLILAESVEGQGRFTDKILDAVWSICEESYWGLPPHIDIQKAGKGLPDVEDPTVDLFSAETAAVLAWTDYFAGARLEKISPLIRPRIYYEVNRRVLTPMQTAKYGYLGGGRTDVKLNNWAPWVMSNFCTAALLLEKNAGKRIQDVQLALHYTDIYLNGLGDDGGCDEGPSYWTAAGACVFDVLNLVDDATGGKAAAIYHHPLIRQMGDYIYKTHIAGKYFINIADASPQLIPGGPLLYRFGRETGDTVMQGFGSWIMHAYPENYSYPEKFHRTRSLYDLLAEGDCIRYPPSEPALKNAWFNDIQLMVARNDRGWFVASHGGNNGESHNHNDVGDFMVYAGGHPVIIDVGSGTYTARTFSNHRYDLWFNASAYHNLPVVNGYQQKGGSAFAATEVAYGPGQSLTMDIAKAYPAEAGIGQLRRTVEVGRDIVITDNYKMRAPLQSLTQTFMTVCAVDLSKAGAAKFTTAAGGNVVLQYDAGVWDATLEKVDLGIPEEEGVHQHWGGKDVYRVLLKAKRLPQAAKVRWKFALE